MDGGMTCLKYFLFLFNLILSILGAAITGIGIWLRVNPTFFKINMNFEAASIYPAIYIAIAVGVVLIVIGVLGCCGAFGENRCLLMSYIIIVSLLLILEIVAAALIFKIATDSSLKGKFDDFLQKQFIDKYYTNDKAREFVDMIQLQLKCCGINGTESYKGKGSVPASCGDDTGSFYKQGCSDRVIQFLKDKAVIIGGITLAAFVLQAASVIFAICLYCAVRQNIKGLV